MDKINKQDMLPFVNAMKDLTKTPDDKFTGAEVGVVKTISPLVVKIGQLEIGESFMYISPFCQIFKTDVYKHKHKYDDLNDGDNSSGSKMGQDTSEELAEVTVWRGLKVGDKVAVLRTNNSQKYILMFRLTNLNDKGV